MQQWRATRRRWARLIVDLSWPVGASVNEGISKEGELIDMGVELGLVEKSGAWYSYNGDRIGQGRDNVRDFLRENADIADAIESAVRQKMGIDTAKPDPIVTDEAPVAEAESAKA